MRACCLSNIFWSLFYEWMFPEESFHQAKEQTNDLIELTGIEKGAVLDLCCGPGRYSVPFRKKGFKVSVISRNCDYIVHPVT